MPQFHSERLLTLDLYPARGRRYNDATNLFHCTTQNQQFDHANSNGYLSKIQPIKKRHIVIGIYILYSSINILNFTLHPMYFITFNKLFTICLLFAVEQYVFNRK